MMKNITAGFALCGSFCTFSRVIPVMRELKEKGIDLVPIMSYNAYSTDTRFGRAKDFVSEIEKISGRKVISTITEAEPIGPKKLLDVLVVEPCTGNTLSKIANGITDTPVTMAVKSHLRNKRPVLIAVSTNDALSTSAQNIGRLLNQKNIYFVPMKQDEPEKKPTSLVADFSLTYDALISSMWGKQISGILI